MAVQRYLDALANLPGETPADPVVRELLARAVGRLEQLCTGLLYRSYPRLTRGPVNLRSEEMLSAVVERLLKALRKIHPQTTRQFFALASQHIRWELNDVARRLDLGVTAVGLRESMVGDSGYPTEVTQDSPSMSRILATIEALPEGEKEAFNLVRIQGLTQLEAAEIAGCSERTLQRRLSRGLLLLTQQLGDLRSPPSPTDDPAS